MTNTTDLDGREPFDVGVLSEPGAESTGPLAAVDLGSNSFHMVIARFRDGELEVVDRLRDRVRLAGGLNAENRLGRKTRQRALRCLEAFRARLDAHGVIHVATAGTCTFRRAGNGMAFKRRAEAALGHPIRIIDGREEARLVYLGVSRETPPVPGRRLVIDIGGGSTECVLGRGETVLAAESLEMGCVSYSRRFFPEGRFTRAAFKAAIKAARRNLDGLEDRFGAGAWKTCLGSSGTIRTAARVLSAYGWSRTGITLKGLKKLRNALVTLGHLDGVAPPGLKPHRAPVFPGGLAILLAVFDALSIETMAPVRPALREGLIHDLGERLRARAEAVCPAEAWAV